MPQHKDLHIIAKACANLANTEINILQVWDAVHPSAPSAVLSSFTAFCILDSQIIVCWSTGSFWGWVIINLQLCAYALLPPVLQMGATCLLCGCAAVGHISCGAGPWQSRLTRTVWGDKWELQVWKSTKGMRKEVSRALKAGVDSGC